jgi:hypothetical protein
MLTSTKGDVITLLASLGFGNPDSPQEIVIDNFDQWAIADHGPARSTFCNAMLDTEQMVKAVA